MTTQNNRSTSKPKTVKLPNENKPSSKLKVIGGSDSDEWNHVMVNQTMQTLWVKHSDDDEQQKLVNATISALKGIEPRDELEGMMAAQLVAAHNAAMECYRRAMIGEQTFEGRKENLNQANKLSRTWTTLLDALNKYRGKGQQKVTVEHVHVHAGGQAVVGTVEQPGGGERNRNEEQPHARQITNAPQPEMRSADPQREAMPVSSDGK
jgi:hypothetical protein